MLILHVQIDVINPADSSTVSLRLTNVNESFATALGGQNWLPVIKTVDDLEMRFFSGDFSGDTAVQTGNLVLRSTPVLNDSWATYVFDGGRLQIWATNVAGTAPSNATKIFDGLAGQCSRSLNEYTIGMKSPAAIASNPVQTSVYAGTGGAEGPSDIKGNIKPYGIGACFNVQPVLVNASKQIYHVSTVATSLDGVFENGVSFTWSGTSFVSYATMDAAASPPQGQYTYCLDPALGLFFRLGAEPAGLITCDFKGDLGTTAYAGAAVKKLLDLAGMPSWRYDSSRVTAFNTAVSNVTVNRYFSSEQSVEEAISEILQGVGGYYGFDELGILFMGLTRIGSSSATFSHARDAAPVVRRIDQLPTSAPAWRLKLNAQRTWRVHSSDEISDALKTAASTAQSTADAAVAALNNIAADGWLTASEKKVARTEYDAITNEYADLVAKGNNFQLSSLVTALTNAKNTLDTYISGLAPSLTSSSDTAITRATWIANWSAYYVAKTNLVDAIGQASASYSNLYLTSIGSDVPTILGNSFKRANTTNDANCCVSGSPAYATAMVAQDYTFASQCAAALDDENTTTALASQKYLLWTGHTGSGTWEVYNNGVLLSSGSGIASTNKQLFITYDGVNVRFFADSTLLYTISNVAGQQTLWPKWWAIARSDSIKGLMATPYSDNNWTSVGGTGRPSDYANVGAVGDANRVRFSKFEQEMLGWTTYNPGTSTITSFFVVHDATSDRIAISGTAVAGQNVGIVNDVTNKDYRIPVTPGERIFVGAGLEVVGGGGWQLIASYRDNANAVITTSIIDSGASTVAQNTLKGNFVTVPAGTVFLSLEFYLTPGFSGAYTISIGKPMVCGAAPNQTVFPAFSPGPTGEGGAQVNRWIDNPTQRLTFKYDYTGTAESGEFNRDIAFKLMSSFGQTTSGITWTYLVQSGTVNGFTSASGVKSMSGAGTGTLTVSSLGSNEATVLVTASYQGKTFTLTITLKKEFGAPPTGGGSGTTTIASKGSGFTGVNSTTFTVQTGTMTGTMPAGKTTANIVVNLEFQPGTGATGNWTVELKVMRNIGGTWTQIGSTQSANSSYVDFATEPDDFINAVFSFSQSDTGLTAGSTYDWRIEARITSGTRSHSAFGDVVITA